MFVLHTDTLDVTVPRELPGGSRPPKRYNHCTARFGRELVVFGGKFHLAPTLCLEPSFEFEVTSHMFTQPTGWRRGAPLGDTHVLSLAPSVGDVVGSAASVDDEDSSGESESIDGDDSDDGSEEGEGDGSGVRRGGVTVAEFMRMLQALIAQGEVADRQDAVDDADRNEHGDGTA
jgi:hypothetical protein